MKEEGTAIALMRMRWRTRSEREGGQEITKGFPVGGNPFHVLLTLLLCLGFCLLRGEVGVSSAASSHYLNRMAEEPTQQTSADRKDRA